MAHAPTHQDAPSICDAGVKGKGTGIPKWLSIMTEQSLRHLQKVFDRYKSYSPSDMLKSIEEEVPGALENALLNLPQCIQSGMYWGCILQTNRTHGGQGTPDKDRVRIMVPGSEADVLKAGCELKRKHSKSLYCYLQKDTQGAPRKRCCSWRGG